MKHLLPTASIAVLFAACHAGTTEPQNPVTVTAPAPPAPVTWVGFYADTMPCADCAGIFTQLDLRGDSTYILREQYLGRDSVPFGTIGTWRVEGDRLTLKTFHEPIHWKRTGDRLDLTEEDNLPDKDAPANFILRVPVLKPSPMHLTGGFVADAGSHSFTPCGTNMAFPVMMDPASDPGVARQLAITYRKQVKKPGNPLFVQVTASMRTGPAMEGSGTQEYLHMDRIDGVLEVQECR